MNNAANFRVYQASAGAGKTFTLIKEYLRLCLANEGAVSNFRNILAITFTNAAANEMKAKIVNNLCEIIGIKAAKNDGMKKALMAELGIAEEALKANAQSLLTNIMHDYSSFCVSTIDAFVQKLSRGFAHELGLPSQYTVSIDDDEMAETIIENLAMEINGQDDLLTRSLVDFSEYQFESEHSTDVETKLSDFIKKLMTEKAYQNDEGNQIMDIGPYQQTLSFLQNKEKTFEERIKVFVADFKAVESRHGLQTEDYWQKRKGVCAFIKKLADGEYDSPNSYFSKAIDDRKCLSDLKKQAANEELLAVLEPLREYFDAEFGSYLFYKSQRNLLYLYALRAFIMKEFKELVADEEVVHISEFNKRLNEVMGDFTVPFLYERIGERFQHVFVDEFQDTSVLQWQNLLPLIDNGLGSGNMSMVVGDGKQSIYRFRSGEVGQIVNLPDIYALPQDARKPAFEQYQNTLRRNYNFTNLGTNYRSFENVVKFNNAFFEETYRQLKPETQKVYVDSKPGTNDGVKIHQENDKQEKGLVQVELFDAESQKDYYPARIEAIVCDLVNNLGYSYGDIAVLTRAKELGGRIANHLNDCGIPVVSQDSILLKSSDKVQLLVSTLRYMIVDDDMVNAANLLYYWKLCQTPDFAGDVSHWFDVVKLVMEGQTDMESEMGLESGLLRSILSKATCLYDFCASLLRIYGLDSLRDAFVNYFMEEVFKWQNGTLEGIREFLNHWEKKSNSLSVKSVEKNAVQIMTIHKSKGLEFPVVIYPKAITDLDENMNKRKGEEEWLRPDELGFENIPNLEKVMFILDGKAEKMGEVALQHVEKEKESNRLDNLNLLYVAFTRAVQRLYVMAPQKKEAKSNTKTEKMHVLQDFLESKSGNKVSEDESGADVMMYRFGDINFRNPKEGEEEEKPVATMTESHSTEWFSRISVEPDPTQLWQAVSDMMHPREWGELVHQIFSKIRCVEDADAVLLPYLHEGAIDLQTAGALKDKFLQMSQHLLIAPAFSPEAKVKTECEVFDPIKRQVLRFDRYAELPDVIYLIDYKTGMKTEENTEQIKNYADVLSRMTNKEIRSYLVYLSEADIELV